MMKDDVGKLLQCGISLRDLGVENWALDKGQVNSVLETIAEFGRPILGGDVYQLRAGKLYLAYSNWSCEILNDEPFSKYVKRSIEVARNYVTQYPSHDTEPALFALVVGNAEKALKGPGSIICGKRA